MISIRKYQDRDYKTIVDLSKRLNEVELMEHQKIDIMKDSQEKIVKKQLESKNNVIFVAEDNDSKEVIGFIILEAQKDYFSNEDIIYVSSIVVRQDAESKGIGKQLLERAEEWATIQNINYVVLEVFSNNTHAIDVYKHLNYKPDVVRMMKTV